MKIQPARIDSFVKNLPENCPGVLLYGPDSGLVSERAEIITEQVLGKNPDPFLITEITSEKLKDDPGTLANEMASVSFFNTGRKLIKIRDAADSLSAILKPILGGHKGKDDPFIIVFAGELTPRSSLRALAEKEASFASVPCYQEDSGALTNIVRTKLREAGYTYEIGIPELIAANCMGNRMVLNQELTKLQLYMGERKQVTSDDVYACIVEVTESSMDNLCSAVAGRDAKVVAKELKKAYQEGMMPVTILRYVSNYFMRFYLINSQLKQGRTEQEAIEMLKPPVFFKQVPVFKKHISYWARGTESEKRLQKALKAIMSAELECKKTNINPELLTSHYLTEVTKVA